MLDLEDASFVYDLKTYYGEKTKFDQFWNCAKEYIEEDVGTAVDVRRHSTVVHIAKAISVRDLCDKVVERCPPDTHVMDSFTVFSFLLVKSHAVTIHRSFTSKAHCPSWRKQHEDSHYTACLFRYKREYALLVRDHTILILRVLMTNTELRWLSQMLQSLQLKGENKLLYT